MPRSEELEREVEAQRARVDRSLSALQEKMTVGQFVDQAGRYIHMDDVRQGFGNFGRQVRDNPLALGMIGAGIGWLMLGGGNRHTHSYGYSRSHVYGPDEPTVRHSTSTTTVSSDESHSSTIGSIGRKASEAGSKAAAALSAGGRRARSAFDHGRQTMHDMRDGGESVYRGGRHYGGRMSRTFSDAMENEPLIVGAFALAIGVAIGACLPSTRREDELFGEMRDEAFSRAGDAARETGHRVADAAKETYATARQAAADEGLTGSGDKTIAERVETVARKTAAEAKDQASGKTDAGAGHGTADRP
jgi:hypothetical protein